jgi:hypothetical protein
MSESEYNIKISELNPFVADVKTEDFFPLVDSSSMTTFRATIQDIGSLITHSLSASYVPSDKIGTVSHSISASYSDYAVSASYAISASHALLADSASYYPAQKFQVSCSWASRSLQSYYATRALDVDTHGAPYNFPYWTSDTPGAGNANLVKKSPLVYYSNKGLISVDSASTNLPYYLPFPNHRPDIKIYRFGDRANVPWGFANNSGIQSAWPITSQTFIGTDQRDWYFSTSSNPHPEFDPDLMVTNSYFSGSAGDETSGSFYTIPEAPGALASIFNGKWVRFAAVFSNPNFYDDNIIPGTPPPIPQHPAHGTFWINQDQRMFGLISLQLQTPMEAGSNAWNQIDFWFHQGQWGHGISAQVFHVNNYGPQLIRAIRFHSKKAEKDPPMFIDMLIDGLYAGGESPVTLGEPTIMIRAQSWQGVRFLKWLNVDPWPIEDSGSNDITKDESTLIIPAAPGFYTNVPIKMNYYIQGKNVVIWPKYNEITQSGLAVSSMISPYSLAVSGTINTNTKFNCDGHDGITTKVTYGTTNLYFSGGILVDRYPPVEPPPAPPPVVGTPCGGGGTWQGGNTMPDEQIWNLGSKTGIVTVHFYTYQVPDRLQVLIDDNVVLNTGYRGVSSNPLYSNMQGKLNDYLATYGSASENMTGGPQLTASFCKCSSTPTCKVQVFGPFPSTQWKYWISCPDEPIK